MEDGLFFLARLGLDGSADARAIRRAYARELKQVDQARDPHGFQALRECYETALGWAAWMADQGREAAHVPEAAPAPAEAPASCTMPQPVSGAETEGRHEPGTDLSAAALGCLVFEQFRTWSPPPGPRSRTGAENVWMDALGAALADERLLNFDASLAFELRLAQSLAGGWQPGHEALFPAAAALFGWDRDRRTLARLGMAGELLDLAIDERTGFFAQDIQAQTRQRQALALLRAPAPCADRRILAEMAVVEQMMLRFPHWLPLIAPMAEVERWRERYWDRKGRRASGSEEALARLSTIARLRRIALWAALGLLFVSLLAVLADGGRSDQREARQQARHELPLSQRQLDEIGERIEYRPGPLSRPGIQRASFEVLLDEEGAIVGVKRREVAADPAYTEAVEKAIRTTKPFPAGTIRRFEIYYWVELKADAAAQT